MDVGPEIKPSGLILQFRKMTDINLILVEEQKYFA